MSSLADLWSLMEAKKWTIDGTCQGNWIWLYLAVIWQNVLTVFVLESTDSKTTNTRDTRTFVGTFPLEFVTEPFPLSIVTLVPHKLMATNLPQSFQYCLNFVRTSLLSGHRWLVIMIMQVMIYEMKWNVMKWYVVMNERIKLPHVAAKTHLHWICCWVKFKTSFPFGLIKSNLSSLL